MTMRYLTPLTILMLAVTAANELANPGIEDGFTGWQVSAANVSDGTNCASGSGCARITSGGWIKQQVSLLDVRDQVDEFEARLAVSAKFRTQPGTRGHVVVYLTDSSETHVVHRIPFAIPTSSDNEFVAEEHNKAVAIKGARSAIVEIGVEEGEAEVDDVAFSVLAATGDVECTVGDRPRYGATAHGRAEFPPATDIVVNGEEVASGIISMSVEAPAMFGGLVAFTWSPQPQLASGGGLLLGEHDSLSAHKLAALTWTEQSQLATSVCTDLVDVRGDLSNDAFGWESYAVDDRTLGQRFVKSIFELNRAKRADGTPIYGLESRDGDSFTLMGTGSVILLLPVDTTNESAGYSARVYPTTVRVRYETVLEIETSVDNVLTDRSTIAPNENGLLEIALSMRGATLERYEVVDVFVRESTFELDQVKDEESGDGDDKEVVVWFQTEDVRFSDSAIDFRVVFDVTLHSRTQPDDWQSVTITMAESYSVHQLTVDGSLNLNLHLCDVSGQRTSVVSSEEVYRAIMWYHEPVESGAFTLTSFTMVHEDGTLYRIVVDGAIAPAGVEGEARFLDRSDGLTVLDQFGLEYRPGLVASTKSGTFSLHFDIKINADIFQDAKRLLEAAGHTVRDGGVVVDDVGVRQLIVESKLTIRPSAPVASPSPTPGKSAGVAAAATLLTAAVTMATLLFV